MSESILRLRVQSDEYDNKLKRAADGLQRYIEGCRKAGGTLEHLDDGVEDFTKSLGNMGTAATGAKGKLNEMTKTFTDLSMEYKQLTDQEKAAPFGKALSASLDQLQGRIQQTKADLNDINSKLSGAMPEAGGGLFSGDKFSGMLQVFGGNVMTKLAGVGVGFISEMGDMVKQGIELAKAGEGVRLAFERLNQPGLLDNLREATHGTVTDLELMKAAVQFNDFKLPVEELGTMLAFAQQKAKDTGQSVEYMTQSIVTGLGRKSLMILDNLGLSAAEIKERMKETGDMTKAVGEIIREQMSKAGDYVETAADRATQANVSLQNKMEELGRKFGPLEQASSNLWTSIKIGIMDIVGGPLTEFINKLTEAGRLAQKYSVLGGSSKVGRMINNLSEAREGNRQSVYQQQQEQFWRYINPREQQIRDIQAWQRGERGEALQKRVSAITDKYGSLDGTKIQAEVDAAKKILSDYQQAAKQILQPISQEITPTITTSGGATGGGTTTKVNAFDVSKIAFTGGEGAKANPDLYFQSVWGMVGDQGLRDMLGIGKQQTDLKRVLKEYVADPDKSKRSKTDVKDDTEFINDFNKVVGNVGNITTGLQTLGVDLPEGFTKTIAAIQTISGILSAILTITTVISAATQADATASWLDAIIPFAHGGKVPHAATGYYVPGTRYSGDTTPILANAGELVLNKSSQSNLAADLQHAESLVKMLDSYQASFLFRSQMGSDVSFSGGLMQNLQLSTVITGEQLRLVLNNNGRRTGRGEYVQTTFNKQQ